MINVTEAVAVQKKLPEGWRWAPLGEVCQIVSGSTPSSANTNYWHGDIAWITPTDLGKLKGMYITFSERTITEEGYRNCSVELLPPGTVVMSSRAPIGYLGVAHIPLCTNQGCKSFIPGKEVDSVFLYFILQHSVSQIKALGSGATFAEVSKSQLQSFLILLPPLPVQQRIAHMLTGQLAAVAEARAAAEVQLDAAQELPAAYLREVFESDDVATWKQCRVQDLCATIDYGHTASADFGIEEPKFLRITDIQDGNVNWDTVPGCAIIPKDEHANRLDTGDIVFARTGATTGKSFLLNKPPRAVFASYLIRLRANQHVLPQYLYTFFQSPQYWQQIQEQARGAAQPNVNATLLGDLQIPLPTSERQQQIAHNFEIMNGEIQQTIASIKMQIASIDTLPAALLRQAFSGVL